MYTAIDDFKAANGVSFKGGQKIDHSIYNGLSDEDKAMFVSDEDKFHSEPGEEDELDLKGQQDPFEEEEGDDWLDED